MIDASAKSKPTPARNSGHDLLLLPQARDPRISSAYARPRHKWIVGLWLLSAGVTTMAWWVGLSWAAIWFVERTLS
jgi:hypothetical protein